MKDTFSSVSIQGCRNLVIKTHGMYVCCILIDSDTQEFCGKMQCVKSSVITHVAQGIPQHEVNISFCIGINDFMR